MKSLRCLWAGLLVLGLATEPPAPTRTLVFVSDTHLGVGKVNGKWHPYEDARWADEFGKFLEFINGQGHGTTDLIFNGDTFELWQSLSNDCAYPDKNLGCSEADVVARLRKVLEAHKEEIKSIHDFAVAGTNSVFLIPGNHDAGLMFSGAAAEVLKAIGAPADKVAFVRKGYWLSEDKLIYAEHGHQIGSDVNRFRNWPDPFITTATGTYLSRPWGEKFVQDYYNQFENKYPIIDNISPETEGLKYGFAAEGLPTTFHDFGLFVRFYLTQQSVLQLTQSLGEDEGGGWDIDVIRAKGNAFFYESIPTNDPLRAATKKAVESNALGLSMSDLTADEIKGICESRQQMSENRESGVNACPKQHLGGAAEAVVRTRETILMTHLNDTAIRLQSPDNPTGRFQLFIYSHTHVPESPFSPFQHTASAWMPIVMNTGAWQRTANKTQLDTLINTKKLRAVEVLNLQPEDLPACYPYIIVLPYTNNRPVGQLKYWTYSGTGWTAKDQCE